MIDAAQLGKIASRIESSHDGEALTAARMLIKRLGGHGLRLADVVERGIPPEKTKLSDWLADVPAYRSPPTPTHRVKINALLSDVRFMGEYLTRRSVGRLQSLYMADFLDPINMQWVDGLMEKARAMKSGGVA